MNQYICPMHPEVLQDKPGMCPECGMNLVPTKKSKMLARRSHGGGGFLTKFWVSLILTIPVVINHFINFAPLWVSGILASIIFFYCGWVFLAGAWREIRGKLPGMMTLIGIAVMAAYLWSVYAIFADEEALFWELSTLITIMLLGHWLEMRAVSGAQGALKELSKLLPDKAEVERNGKTEVISLTELREGDVVIVRPGGKVPADGKVNEGESDLNESMVTGESNPVSKKEGDTVIAGTINGDGLLKVLVTQIGEKTFLAGVMRLVAEAQASKSRLQILSDRAALYLTGVAVVGGIITLISWLVSGADVAFAVARLVAVLVIACPHALGLAVPLVASISTTKAAHSGFLVKQRLALEAARSINVVLFDKTGTLTEGKFGVTKFSSDEALALAASVDAHSEHPIALGIVNEAKRRNIVLKDSKNFKRVPGRGAEAEVEGLPSPDGYGKASKKVFVGHKGGDDIVVEVDGKEVGSIEVRDTVRFEAKEAIAALQENGIKIAMITGDSEEVAKEVSSELGIDEYFARVMPGEKSEKVKELQGRGLKVGMVGDGINDAPALTQADLGIAIGAGTNVAIESAGIILVRNDPRDIVKIVRLSKLTYKKMIQNLWWAAGYNIFAMPLAAGVLAFKGIVLEPAVAAVLMSASTVIVAINAVLLKNKKL